MMKNLRNDMKLIGYGFNKVQNLVCMGLFFAIGVLMQLFTKGEMLNGSLFMMISPMFLVQMLYSASMADVVASSPRKKELQTLTPAICNFVGMLLVYVLLIAIIFGQQHLYPENVEHLNLALFYAACLGAMIMIYSAFAYKTFWVAVLFFFVIFFASFYSMQIGAYADNFRFPLSLPLNILLGLGMLVVGALIEYGCSLLVYKLPLSTRAMDISMRKYLK